MGSLILFAADGSGLSRWLRRIRCVGLRPQLKLNVRSRVSSLELESEDMESKVALLRPAKPEPSEGLFFARYINEAADGFFSFMLGVNAEGIIARAFIEQGHALSYEHVMFAELDGVIAGMSLAYTGAQHSGFSDQPLKRAAGRSVFRMKIVRTLLAPLWRILDTIPEGDFYIQGLAVEPELRGAGIGSLLLDDIEGRARASGSTRLSLDVAAKNKGARRLYARRGWIESSEWPSLRLLPTVFVRMTKDL